MCNFRIEYGVQTVIANSEFHSGMKQSPASTGDYFGKTTLRSDRFVNIFVILISNSCYIRKSNSLLFEQLSY